MPPRLHPFGLYMGLAVAVLALSSSTTAGSLPSTEEFITVNRLVEEQCNRYRNVEPELVWALIWTESRYDPLARGSKGEVGLGQLMPATAKALGVKDRTDARESVTAVAHHLAYLLRKYGGDKRLALAAYNGGEPLVDRCRCVPAATRAYVNLIETDRYPFAKNIVEYVRKTTALMSPDQQKRIEELQATVAELERQQRLRASRGDSSATGATEQELANARSALEREVARRDALEQERDQLRQQLEVANSENRRAIDDIKDQLGTVDGKLGDLGRDIAAIGSSSQSNSSELSALQSRLQSLQAEMAALRATMQGQNLRDEQVWERLADLSATLAKLNSVFQSANTRGGSIAPPSVVSHHPTSEPVRLNTDFDLRYWVEAIEPLESETRVHVAVEASEHAALYPASRCQVAQPGKFGDCRVSLQDSLGNSYLLTRDLGAYPEQANYAINSTHQRYFGVKDRTRQPIRWLGSGEVYRYVLVFPAIASGSVPQAISVWLGGTKEATYELSALR